MRITYGKCSQCQREFKYFQYTKPRTICSGACEYRREREQQNERRRAAKARELARRGTLNEQTQLTVGNRVVHCPE